RSRKTSRRRQHHLPMGRRTLSKQLSVCTRVREPNFLTRPCQLQSPTQQPRCSTSNLAKHSLGTCLWGSTSSVRASTRQVMELGSSPTEHARSLTVPGNSLTEQTSLQRELA